MDSKNPLMLMPTSDSNEYHPTQQIMIQQNNTSSNSSILTSQNSLILKPRLNDNATTINQNEFEILMQENQKLSTITRLCIHLVDRSRLWNKSKNFVEDLQRLNMLIEDFNRVNTNKCNQLPVFNNDGILMLSYDNNMIEKSQNVPTQQKTTIQPSQQNVYLVPITTCNQQYQLLQTNDNTVVQVMPSGSTKKKPKIKSKQRQSSSSNLQMMMNQGQVAILEQQDQQSILFKKLTKEQQQQHQFSSITGTSSTIDPNNAPILAFIESANQIDSSNIENDPVNIHQHSFVSRNHSNQQLSGTDPQLPKSLDESEKKFKCHICDKKYTSSYNLNRHIKAHSSGHFPPFACHYPDCSKRFNYSYHLKRHIEIHTGEKPFVCTWPDCDQRFNRKYNLNRHLWVHAEHKKHQQQPSNNNNGLIQKQSSASNILKFELTDETKIYN